MNRSDLVREYHERRRGYNREASEEQVGLLFDIIREKLVQGEKVTIHNLGAWSVVEHKARKGRNPQTNEEMHIPKRKKVRFKASRTLINEVQAAS